MPFKTLYDQNFYLVITFRRDTSFTTFPNIMKSIKLYYNPTAGEGENSKQDLIRHIENAGYKVIDAVRHKKGISKVEAEADILAVAGGDGTVRSACLDLLNMPLKHSRPVGLLALGTANNIARTLHINKDVAAVIRSWEQHRLKRFDVGSIDGLKTRSFFVESFGCGIFPRLIKKMSKLSPELVDTPEKEFDVALEKLVRLVRNYKATPCTVYIDGKKHQGKYIMAEVMNIQSLGPKLVLAPGADPGDGRFNVLLLTDRQRDKLIGYIEKIRKGINAKFPFASIKGRDIELYWEGKDMHIDDELVEKYKPVVLKIKLLDGMLDFLVQKK